MSAALLAPLIHINGSGVPHLLAAIEAAHSAVIVALEALGETRPNGRDYYPQGDEAMRQAEREHRARVEHLVRVRDELMLIAENIQDQVDGSNIP